MNKSDIKNSADMFLYKAIVDLLVPQLQLWNIHGSNKNIIKSFTPNMHNWSFVTSKIYVKPPKTPPHL